MDENPPRSYTPTLIRPEKRHLILKEQISHAQTSQAYLHSNQHRYTALVLSVNYGQGSEMNKSGCTRCYGRYWDKYWIFTYTTTFFTLLNMEKFEVVKHRFARI